MPKLYIIAGCNGSGKTTASYALLPKFFQCSQYVNSDEFAKSLEPFNPEKASVAASRYMLQKIGYLLGRNEDFSIETTLATRYLLTLIKEAKEKGYYVTILYFWLNSPELALERVKARVSAGGHNIPTETIRRRYYMGLNYFFKDYAPVCDRWILADNSILPFTVVAERSEDGVIIRDTEKYSRILKQNEDYERSLKEAKEQEDE